MAKAPPCKRIRRACRELDVTIRVADLEDDSRAERDAAATWILGHTERISFGELYAEDGELLVDARIHVPCRFLKVKDPEEEGGRPRVKCKAYGYKDLLPPTTQGPPPQIQNGNGEFFVYHKHRRRKLKLPYKKKKTNGKQLPVLQSENPCATASCRTSDNKVGAACCRDLQLELVVPKKAKKKEALLKTRKSPYLCKVKREDKYTLEAEVITACGYLDDDGISCVLHDRERPDGESAKPPLCYEWPEFEEDETGHPGCVFVDD